FLAAEDEVVARTGVSDAGVLVKQQAVDGHRRAVLSGGAAESLELGNITRAVELKLHEGVPGMLADIVRRVRIAADQVIAVGVRRARLGELGRGLGVAQREPEPERGPQLEVPGGAAGTRRVRLGLRILRQGYRVGHVVARTGTAGLEQDGRLVVADVLAGDVAGGIDAGRLVTLAERLVDAPRGVLEDLSLGGGGARGARGARGKRAGRQQGEAQEAERSQSGSLQSLSFRPSAKPGSGWWLLTDGHMDCLSRLTYLPDRSQRIAERTPAAPPSREQHGACGAATR